MEDSQKELSVMVDRAIGGSSILDGQIELMLHRFVILAVSPFNCSTISIYLLARQSKFDSRFYRLHFAIIVFKLLYQCRTFSHSKLPEYLTS